MKRKSKIVATISPNCLENGLLEKMIDNKVDVFRLNFSYGTHEEYKEMINRIRKSAQSRLRPVAILQDLAGSKIRIGSFEEMSVELVQGEHFIFSTNESIVGNKNTVYVNHLDLPSELKKDDRVVLGDGDVEMSVLESGGSEILCVITQGGRISSGRGLSVPGIITSIPILTEKDKEDLRFGVEEGIDFVALSFVQSAEDVFLLKSFLEEICFGKNHPDIIAKIETLRAVENLKSIIEVADGAMVARGDLAIEILPEEVPLAQKKIINICNAVGKPVITATQMLESMVNSPKPTRAETSDIANAILDGTDAVMLSGETAIGKFPLHAIKAMTRTALQIEKEYPERRSVNGGSEKGMDVVNVITTATVRASHDLSARLIIALTDSGFTGRMLARHKPKVPIVAMAPDEQTCRKLALSFGCLPVLSERPKDLSEAFDLIRKFVLENDFASEGDKVAVAAGVPFDDPNIKTNMFFVEKI